MNSPSKPPVVLPRVPFSRPWTWRWAYLNTRGYLYLPIFIMRTFGRVFKAIVYNKLGRNIFATKNLRTQSLLHGILDDWDYMYGGPGVLPPFFWWRLGIEQDGSKRLPEHNKWTEYKLDGYGGYEVTKPGGGDSDDDDHEDCVDCRKGDESKENV